MASAPFLTLGALAFVVLMTGGASLLWYRRKVRRQQRQNSWREPRIDIRYTISSSEVSSSGGRQLADLQFDFDVALRGPGAKPVRLNFQVKPLKDVPFDVMAQRAFEELSRKLGTTFFRADSKAFQALHPRAP
jgi:hypothetical protein